MPLRAMPFAMFAAVILSIACAVKADDFIPEVYQQFMRREMMNSHFESGQASSEIDPRYQPSASARFNIPYLLIPRSDLHLWQSEFLSEQVANHVFDQSETGNAELQHIRFFIHPESISLYQPLIDHYGIAGFYTAWATSSTRTVLAWDTLNPNKNSLFLKLSLDKRQLGLGRPVPDWEVRRSITMTTLTSHFPEQEMKDAGLFIVPEPMGTFIDRRWARGSYVDAKQGKVFQHGYLARDPGWILKFSDADHEVMPLFALFYVSKQRKVLPLFEELWREEHAITGVSFSQFAKEAFLRPIVRALGYLLFKQGILTEPHAQNAIVVVNRKTRKIDTLILRDLGSFKANFMLRMSRGLPLESLITHNTTYDFKPEWTFEIMGKPIYTYFHQSALAEFRRTLKAAGRPVTHINSIEIDRMLDELVDEELNRYMPLGKKPTSSLTVISPLQKVNDWTQSYIEENKPPGWNQLAETAVPTWLESQMNLGQMLNLPASWCLPYGIMTDAGYVMPCHEAKQPRLIFIPTSIHLSEGQPVLHRQVNLLVTTQSKVVPLSTSEPPPVVRAGSPENPVFYFLNPDQIFEVNTIRSMADPAAIVATLIADFAGLPEQVQQQALSSFGIHKEQTRYEARINENCEHKLL